MYYDKTFFDINASTKLMILFLYCYINTNIAVHTGRNVATIDKTYTYFLKLETLKFQRCPRSGLSGLYTIMSIDGFNFVGMANVKVGKV